MGQKEDTKKTLAEVQADLLKSLYDKARSLVTNPPPAPSNPTVEDLALILDALARQKFQAQYGYEYKASLSVPVKYKDIKNLNGVSNLLNITSDDSQVEQYVNLVLNGTGITSTPVTDAARGDLVRQARFLFNGPIQNEWAAVAFDKTYEDPQPNMDSWKADLMLIQCNAGLTIDGVSAKFTLIYFLGVYFEIISEDVLKGRLFTELLERAGNLQGIAAPTDPNIQELEKKLLEVARKKFLTDYSVPFEGNNTRPKDLATGKGPDVRGTSAIYYLPKETDEESLKIFIQTNILSAIDFNRQDVKFASDPAIASLTDELTELLKNNTGVSWLNSGFSGTYDSAIITENSVKTISSLFYTNASLTQDNLTVFMKFIFYMGVYYHIPSPNEAAIGVLLAKLYSTASLLYTPPKQFAQPPTTQGLTNIMNDYGKFRFKEIFGFDFLGDASKPPDMAPPTPGSRMPGLTSNTATVVIADNNWKNINSIVETTIVGGLFVPSWLQDIALENLVKVFLSSKDVSVDDAWTPAKSVRQYEDPISQKGYDWVTRAIVTFSNGVLTQGGITVTRTFINYVGVFYPMLPFEKQSATFSKQNRRAVSEDELFVLLG
jgi:hypothetical protein